MTITQINFKDTKHKHRLKNIIAREQKNKNRPISKIVYTKLYQTFFIEI